MKTTRLFLMLTLACTATTLAVDPPPDGGYPAQNTAEGDDALFSLDTGIANTAIGSQALFTNTVGDLNTATGSAALLSNTAGSSNTATGSGALQTNTTGDSNTASGVNALFSNTTGFGNTASGLAALLHNTTGIYNAATGYFALSSTASGSNNTANGAFALLYSTSNNNTATGYAALGYNTTGSNNTATGFQALYFNTTGVNNVAMGFSALTNNTSGKNNTALGNNALLNNTVGSNNIALGASAGSNLTTGSNNIHIGALGAGGESNTIRLGKSGVQTATFITGIRGATVAGGVTVMVDSIGRLGTITSSARYKEAIQPMDKASEAILSLKPVTFRYKAALDPKGIPQFGLVAEQVEKVNSDLVARDEEGKPYTVRYEAVNAMLLNEFLKEHRKVGEQAATITDLKSAVAQQRKDIAALTAALKAQAAQIQKVSDRIGTQALVPRVVVDN